MADCNSWFCNSSRKGLLRNRLKKMAIKIAKALPHRIFSLYEVRREVLSAMVSFFFNLHFPSVGAYIIRVVRRTSGIKVRIISIYCIVRE